MTPPDTVKSPTASAIDLTGERLVEMLHQMYLIRYFEESAQQLYFAGKVHGTMHLYSFSFEL